MIMRRAPFILSAVLILSCLGGCASLFHNGPYAELTGQKIDEQRETESKTDAENRAEVADGTSVQATTSVQGDGFWMAVRDTAPKLAYALAAVLIVQLSRKTSLRASVEMNSARSRSDES